MNNHIKINLYNIIIKKIEYKNNLCAIKLKNEIKIIIFIF